MSEARDTGLSPPQQSGGVPGVPESFQPQSFEVFDGLNTQSPRPAIKDTEMAWCDGFMRVGANYLRILWGTGTIAYTAPGGVTVVWFGFGNIADQSYCVVLRSDGAVDAVALPGGGVSSVMTAGTILNPSNIFGFSQWGNQYLIFTKDQDNGYWLWDAVNLYTAGTIGPVVSLTDSGANYTSAPNISITSTAGAGFSFNPVIENGSISQVTVTTPGSGLGVNDFAILSFLGGGSDDQATAQANLDAGGGIQQIVVTAGGSGYTANAMLTATPVDGNGSGASFAVQIVDGAAVGATIINPGSGYTQPPALLLSDPHGGTGANGFAVIGASGLGGISVIYGGSGYTAPPTVTVVGDGTGATATAQIDASGQVTAVMLTNPGSGYTKALVQFSGGNNAASATLQLMPFGISGTAVETFQSRVWVTNGAAVSNQPPKNRTIFSAPESPVDFGDGGGAFQSFDSFLRVGYHALRQTNGFLYLIGDSSINYISGVQTTTPSSSTVSAQAVTTFGNQNVDPQLGSPWPSSVQLFSRNIIFANTLGIFVSYGGAVTRVSAPLDGFYGSGPIFGLTSNYPGAVANIFNIPVYMLLLPVVDSFTGQLVNKLLMWDGTRFFTSQQDRTLTYITSQEINSVLTAWGTDGANIFPLFAQPSTGFTKVVQSKLFSQPAYYTTKTVVTLSGIAISYALDNPFDISVDSEAGIGRGNAAIEVTPSGMAINWTNNVGAPITWTNNAAQPILWGGPGVDVFGPISVGQQGRLMGFTVETTASDAALLSLMAAEQVYTVNVR